LYVVDGGERNILILLGPVLNIWMGEELLEGLEVSGEDHVKTKQTDVQQVISEHQVSFRLVKLSKRKTIVKIKFCYMDCVFIYI
jgi:hypothetical protein